MSAKEVGTLYRVNGQVLEVFPINGSKFELQEIQAYVGGLIEQVPGTGRKGVPAAYCNEEGRLERLRLNMPASKTFGQQLFGDVIQLRKAKR